MCALKFQKTGIFRPSMLMGDRSEMRLGERIAIPLFRLLSPLMLGGASKYRPIHAAQVAGAMAAFAKSENQGECILEYTQMVKLSRSSE